MENEITLESKIQELEKAKKNVKYLLDNSESLADMKGIEHWAGRVERLRELIKNSL